MDPKPIRFERIEGRKPIVGHEDQALLVEEGIRMREADGKDGTNAFLEAAFSDAVADEPDYTW